MKRIAMLLVMSSMILLLVTGCSKVKIEEGESHVILNKDDSLEVSILHENEDEDDKDDVEDDIDDNWGRDVDIKRLKVNKKTIEATLVFDDYDDFGGIQIHDLDEYFEDNMDYDFEDVEDEELLYDFKKDEVATEKQLKRAKDAKILTYYGEKVYITVPGKILFVSDKFEKINNNTVYFRRSGDSWYGNFVVYE